MLQYYEGNVKYIIWIWVFYLIYNKVKTFNMFKNILFFVLQVL